MYKLAAAEVAAAAATTAVVQRLSNNCAHMTLKNKHTHITTAD
jgi:hypothetical protein